MSIVETVLVFVGVPGLLFAVLAALVVLPGMARRPRYRPGEAWDYEPVWYVPQPVRSGEGGGAAGYPALEGGHRVPALTAGPPETVAGVEAGVEAEPVRTARGGVHDTW